MSWTVCGDKKNGQEKWTFWRLSELPSRLDVELSWTNETARTVWTGIDSLDSSLVDLSFFDFFRWHNKCMFLHRDIYLLFRKLARSFKYTVFTQDWLVCEFMLDFFRFDLTFTEVFLNSWKAFNFVRTSVKVNPPVSLFGKSVGQVCPSYARRTCCMEVQPPQSWNCWIYLGRSRLLHNRNFPNILLENLGQLIIAIIYFWRSCNSTYHQRLH